MMEPKVISSDSEKQPMVIFEDEEILVLDKPAGMTINRSDTTAGEKTVQDWVEGKKILPILPINTNTTNTEKGLKGFLARSGIVHRLDKETSGILLVAKTPVAFENLQGQFKERKVKKTYVALVHGIVKPEEGEIQVPVGRLPWNRKRFGIIAEGRESSTKYKVLSTMYYVSDKEPLTLLELKPATGRTHQIRVHLKYLNHPIVSDALYAGRKRAREDRKVLPRMFLHAEKISFIHPATNKLVSFASAMPADLQSFLDLCQKPS